MIMKMDVLLLNINLGTPNQAFTDLIYQETLKIKEFKRYPLERMNLTQLGVIYRKDDIEVFIFKLLKIIVIDPIEDWLRVMKRCFDFGSIQRLLNKMNFKLLLDGLNGGAGIYMTELFVKLFGVSPICLENCEPLPDFNGKHADPNLVYQYYYV